jgi:signal transduction histidine kinase
MKPTTVLIVDDSPDDVEFLTSILLSHDPGYVIYDAHNSLQGLDELQNWQPDCVLLDFRLGHEDGIEVLDKFLTHPYARPVIMLTGQGSEVVAAAAIKAGASDYLVKMDINGMSLHKSIVRTVESAQMRALLELQEDALKRQSRLQALGHLSAGIAHDFNNMLATIRHAVDGARRAESAELAADKLDIISTVTNRAANRVQSLLVFTNAQSGEKTDRLTSDIVRELEEITRGPISRVCDIQFHNTDPLVSVRCDQTLLQSALLNLILNAADAIGATAQNNGLITFKVSPIAETARVEFCIVDNGGGISDDIIDRVTDPYFTTKQHTGGTGLGLSLVYGFAQQNNSPLDIQSDNALGITSIRFSIPISTRTEVRKELDSDITSHASSGCTRSILLVDDNTVLLSLIGDELLHAGFNVVTANDTETAMSMTAQLRETDAVITDLSLGNSASGLDLAEKIRAKIPNIQIIGMTGYSSLLETDNTKVLDTLLQKPCYIHEMVFVLNSFHSKADGSIW